MRYFICFLFVFLTNLSVAQSDSLISNSIYKTLGRSPFVGAELGTLTEPVRVAYKMKAEKGIIMYKVFPNLAADKAGLIEKDVIIAIDSTYLDNLKELKEFLKTKKGNDILNVFFVRNDTVRNTSLVLNFLPRETNFYFETLYDQIELDSQTSLRTLLTFPRLVEDNEPSFKKFPLIILLNSASNHSVERELYSKQQTSKDKYQFYDWVETLTKNGFATLRIEKKGLGDSNGKLEDWKFEDEQKSIDSVLEKIKKQGNINQNKIYLVALGSSSLVALEHHLQAKKTDSTGNNQQKFQTIFIEKLPANLQKIKYQNTDSLLSFFPSLKFYNDSYATEVVRNLTPYNSIFRDKLFFWIEAKDDILRVLKELKNIENNK